MRTLTDIKKACDYVYEDFGVKVDFSKDNYDDPNVFAKISGGDTMCIFQLESGGMSDLMHRMKPTGLEEIIAGISLYRPGPMQYIGDYIECKFDKSKIKYLHPSMESILAVTNGCIVYQEQVMQLVKKLAGFSTALADNVRYVMSKKKTQMMQDLGQLFIHGGTWPANGETVPGCVNNGIPEDVAQKIYEQLDAFSQYAFNKSHATCYAYVTYQTAWLKTYYPTEFICALLNNRINDIAQIKKYMEYAKSQGIQVLSPCVNKSKEFFSVQDGCLRFGLGGIRNVGVDAVKKIVDERNKNGEFADLTDFFERCFHYVEDKTDRYAQPKRVSFLNKRMIENLIKGGAMDCFGRTRADMLQWFSEEFDEVIESNKKQETGQISIFDMMPELKLDVRAQHEQVAELPKQVLYTFEKDVLGLYMSGSPLDDYNLVARKFNFDFNTSITAPYVPDGAEEGDKVYPVVERRNVVTGGILRDIRIVIGRDNNKMGFAVLEDKYESIEVAIYGANYERFKNLFVADAFVVLKGGLAESREGYKIIIREIINPHSQEHKEKMQEEVVEIKPDVTLWLKMDSRDDETFGKVVDVLEQYQGDIPVKIKIEGKVYPLDQKVRKCSGIEYELGGLLGDKNVVFFQK